MANATATATPELLIPATFDGGINRNENRALPDVLTQIQSLDRRDYVIPANKMTLHTSADGITMTVSKSADAGIPLTDFALRQLNDRLSKGLGSFAQSMIGSNNADIYTDAANTLLSRQTDELKYQLRTIQPGDRPIVRATLSDRFKRIDDDVCVVPMVEMLADHAGKWKSIGGQLTDSRTYLKFVRREPIVRNFGPNGRDVFVGFLYSNSEVGRGNCQFELFLFDEFCQNGMVFGKRSIADVKFRHIGPQIRTEFGLISEDRIAEVELLSIQDMIRDATRKVLTADFAAQVTAEWGRSASMRIDGDAAATVKAVAASSGVPKSQLDAVLSQWHANEPSALGISNAITRLAQDAPTYESRMELERIGGKVFQMTDAQWRAAMILAN